MYELEHSKINHERSSKGICPTIQADKTVEFFKAVARGEVLTNAKTIRNFVQGHKEYKNDSLLSEVSSKIMTRL